jgi:hypothetical protein
VLPQTFAPDNLATRRRAADILVDNTIYRKTSAGHDEIEERRLPLRAELRRLLILIDGNRSSAELARCVRASELPEAIGDLAILGLIASVSTNPSFARVAVTDAIDTRSSMPPRQFEAARNAAAHAASELLGLAARPYCAKLLECRDSLDLRALLSTVQAKLRATLGEDAATIFVESVRDAAQA